MVHIGKGHHKSSATAVIVRTRAARGWEGVQYLVVDDVRG